AAGRDGRMVPIEQKDETAPQISEKITHTISRRGIFINSLPNPSSAIPARPHAILCELANCDGAKWQTRLMPARSISYHATWRSQMGAALYNVVEYRGFWRSLGESNPCFCRESAKNDRPFVG